ncbi:30S ribosomal protein S12 methylthiotransferase RimO [Helicobacter canis]|uniref:30S ribosomal protein S12 methylthiotransferase RimO n=1 Tax=Helicobacter canis TaxID=29419 RepID=UPI0029427F3D|nr:30S ribosomal protein S12 methylthiotransferase RimO [Helicobacter canis]
MRPRLHLISLGCTKNLVDSEVMLGRLSACEISDEITQADVIIINTCGFIHAAKQESIQTILEAANARKNGALLVVSGCLSERYAKELEQEIPEIDLIIGVRDYVKIDALLEQKGFALPRFYAPSPKAPNQALESKILSSSDKVFLADETHKRVIANSRLHAYIKLAEGCNQHCSFCAIPSFKGKLQSRSIESILQEVENLSKEGFVDFSLIAQDSSSYLRDQGQVDGLIQLIKALDSQNLAKNARIHYLYPTTTSPKLIEAMIDSPIVQNYFDMPIQHIADPMLKRMRRNHTAEQVLELLTLMKSAPNAFLRSTFIIGHPGESESEFEQLREFLAQGVFDRVNLFAFSSEEGTLAHTMSGAVPAKIANARLTILQKLLAKQAKERAKALQGARVQAFIESKSAISEYFYSARDRRWGLEIDGEILVNEIALESGEHKNEDSGVLAPGLYEVQITQTKDTMLLGSVVRDLGL